MLLLQVHKWLRDVLENTPLRQFAPRGPRLPKDEAHGQSRGPRGANCIRGRIFQFILTRVSVLTFFFPEREYIGNYTGVNKKPFACQNPSWQELNLDRRFSTFSHLTEIQMTDCRETVLGSKELKTVYHWTFLSSPDLPQKTDLIIAETHYRLFWLFICRSNYTPNSWVVLSVYNTLTLYKKEWLLWYIIQGSTKSGAT